MPDLPKVFDHKDVDARWDAFWGRGTARLAHAPVPRLDLERQAA